MLDDDMMFFVMMLKDGIERWEMESVVSRVTENVANRFVVWFVVALEGKKSWFVAAVADDVWLGTNARPNYQKIDS